MRDDKQPTNAGAPRLHDPATPSLPPEALTSPAQAAPARQRGWLRRLSGYGVALVVMGGLAYLVVAQMPARQGSNGPGGRFGFGGRFGQQGPVPVLVATAATADVPIYFDGVGTARALNAVTVRPQVDGKLLKLNFREGEDVERGAVLAEIDPIIYQAQLDQAIAKKAQDEAQLANARIDLERYTRLAQSNAATKQQADTQKALVAQLEAVVKADQASIDNARAYLDYTKIVAPIAGRTGIRLVDVGNLVRASETTGIVVITQVRPISVIFTLPQQQLPAVNKAFARGPLAAYALGSDNRSIADRGVLQVIDNQVDQTTGTVKLRAEFPNRDLALWPGQFVDVKLLVDTLRDVVVVPTAAVQRGPNGTFAYVVRDGAGGADKAAAAIGSSGDTVRERGNASGNGSGSFPAPQPSPTNGEGDDTSTARAGKGTATVAVRPVTVRQQDDAQAVIASGLRSGERVVTSGFAQLTDDSRIIISREEPFTPGTAGPAATSVPTGTVPPRAAGTAADSAEPSPPVAPALPTAPGAAAGERAARDAAPNDGGPPRRDPRRPPRGDAGARPPR